MTQSEGRGLFLDLDGTLADSLGMLRGVYREFLKGFGREGTDAEFNALNGPPLKTVVERLQQAHGLPGSASELYARYLESISKGHFTVMPAAGARDILLLARRRGWKTAVVTSATTASTETWLERQELSPLIDLVIGGDNVRIGKPDPEPYRLALARTGCRADLSLAVEDSPQGLRAAAGAGLPVCIIGPQGPALAQEAGVRSVLTGFADLAPLLDQ